MATFGKLGSETGLQDKSMVFNLTGKIEFFGGLMLRVCEMVKEGKVSQIKVSGSREELKSIIGEITSLR